MSGKLVNQEIVCQVRTVNSRNNVCLFRRQRFQFLENRAIVFFYVKAASLACRGIYDNGVISAELFDSPPGAEQVVGYRLDGSRILII